MPKEDYQPNSHKYNETHEKNSQGQEKPRKVVAEPARERKSVGSRFKETFFGQSFEEVKDYVVWDIMMPALKDFLYNLPQVILGALFYGDSDYRKPNSRHTDYTKPSSTSSGTSRRNSSVEVSSNPRDYNFERFEFRSRSEAMDVLYEMKGEIEEYGIVSVADFYRMIGQDNLATWISERDGWDNLESARVIPKRGMFVLSLPRPSKKIR